ncbi:MAG TPA: hypothetical protein VD886_12585 [Herpetosiphonaceae bacterium]|nr:hypothetical protein [Herpetosiphonaceae bacterium]
MAAGAAARPFARQWLVAPAAARGGQVRSGEEYDGDWRVFADWGKHHDHWNSLHYLAIDLTRSTPNLLCVEMQWDRTGAEVRIFCGAADVEPWREPADEA